MAVQRSPIVHDRSPTAEEHSMGKTGRTAHSSEARLAPSPRARRGPEAIKFFTIAEVAGCLNVSTRTVRRWIDRRILVAHQFGGSVRIAEADLNLFLALHRDA
jgi:excisionase family DNA binding protein